MDIIFWFGGIITIGISLYLLTKKMARAGNIGFRIGYFMYCKTPFGYWFNRRRLIKARSKFSGRGHSVVKSTRYNDLVITPIALNMDNYSYLICDEHDKTAVLVDPADADVVLAVLAERKLIPSAILTTHKHWDHSAGNQEIRRHFPRLLVYGNSIDSVPGATHSVRDGDVIECGRLKFTALHTPGHTVGHVVYVLDGATFQAPQSLFSGDHLFIGGIGKIFEGDAATMLRSLDRLRSLPDQTLLWPGHEYSLSNLQFAAELEPSNSVVARKLEELLAQRQGRHCTCPSTLAEEKTFNPFLRLTDVPLISSLGLTNVILNSGMSGDEQRTRVLAECRSWKDRYKSPVS